MAEDNGNGKVTLALTKQQLEQLLTDVSAIKEDSRDTNTRIVRLEEFSKTVSHELWHDNRSRMQANEAGIQEAKTEARTAMCWTKAAILPISLAVVCGLIMVFVTFAR